MNHLNLFLMVSELPPDRFFGMDMQTLRQAAVNAVAVILLCIVLTKLLYKPVRTFLRERVERIQSQLNDARESRASASELKARYDRQLKDIDLERAAILEEVRKHAAEQRDQMLNMAKDEVRELKDRASTEIVAERERIRDEIHSAVIDISSDMAEKLLAAAIDRKAHERLFDEGLAELDRVVFSA